MRKPKHNKYRIKSTSNPHFSLYLELNHITILKVEIKTKNMKNH
jgi:hypothetical protein